ncbi:MAG TPA: CAP domain-containing protein [Ramlibacter sp.]
MKNMMFRTLGLACLVALLGGCGKKEDAPVATAPPEAPDTSAMGAGPGGSNCGVRAEEALQRINAARAAGRSCGGRYMPAAPPLQWDQQLYSAAFGHSSDMARANYFEHVSPSGVTVRQRASAARYKWRSLGENLSGGTRGIGDTVQNWLESPDHCENLMDPKFGDVAVACVAQPGTQWGTYWTMVLGRK